VNHLPLIYIVLVNWNNPERTLSTLESIKEIAYDNYRVIVVDNGSDDNSPALIGRAAPEITILNNPVNAGFAGGVNPGIRRALELKADFIWVLNNDLKVAHESLTEMVNLAVSNPMIGAVGSILVEEENGRRNLIYGGGRVNFLNGLPVHIQQDSTDHNKFDYLKGASLLLRAEALRQIGFFSEKYFLYWEDTDLCFRLKAAGWKLRVAQKALVYHEGYGSMVFKSPSWDYHFTRSSIIFFKEYAPFSPLPIMVSVAGRLTLRILRGKWNNAGAIIAATGISHGNRNQTSLKNAANTEPVRTNQDAPVILLDPCCFTPFYDINLGAALARRQRKVEWITSEFPFATISAPATIQTSYLFFSAFPAGPLLKIRLFNRITRLRQIVKALAYPLDMLRLHSRLKKMSPGILHIQWTHLPRLDAWFWKRWQSRGWKVVYTIHDLVPLAGTTPKYFQAGNENLPALADQVLVHSDNSRRQLLRQGLEKEKVSKIPLGPTLTLPPATVDICQARQKLKLPAAAKVILFFGFIKPYKGLDILLQSLPIIEQSINPPHLLVAGQLLEPFSRYQSILEQSPSATQIHWFLDFIPETELATFFAAADLVVTPYRQGSSSSIIDLAHTFNKPVVATRVGGLNEQIDENAGDRLVPPNRADRLAEAIIAVLTETPSTAGPENLNSASDIEAEWDEIAARHCAIYDQLSVPEPAQRKFL